MKQYEEKDFSQAIEELEWFSDIIRDTQVNLELKNVGGMIEDNILFKELQEYFMQHKQYEEDLNVIGRVRDILLDGPQEYFHAKEFYMGE